MERTYLQWNLVNWVTVVLMASLGAVLVGVVAASMKTYGKGSGAANGEA